MKDKKFVIVTGTSMFVLIMMIILNFGGSKSTYSSGPWNIDNCIAYNNDGSCDICASGCNGKKGTGADAYVLCLCINNSSSSSSSSKSSSSSSSSDSAPDLDYCYKCKTSSGDIVAQQFSTSRVSQAIGDVCGPSDNRGTWIETRDIQSNCPNFVNPPANSSSSGLNEVKPSIGLNVDTDNKVHVSLTNLKGCGGQLVVTGSGVSISGTTSKSVSNSTTVTSLVTGAYTKSDGSTKGTITAKFTITSTAAGYSCPSNVSKTITVYDDKQSDDGSITESVCTSGGGTWKNNICSCSNGKEWSNSYKQCRCPIGQKEYGGVCKYAAGVTIVANKDVIIGTTHSLNINTTNGAICGGKVTFTSSAGNSISGFNVSGDTKVVSYKPTKTSNGTADGTDTIEAKLEGIDTKKCYMIENGSTASFVLNLTNDKAKICKQYNGTWNESTKTCNCNNGYYWSEDANKCLAYSPEDDPTRIAPYVQLSWTDKKIKKGSSEKLTICAKASSGTGAAGVGGMYYLTGYNHSNGSLQQEAVPAGGCSNITIHGITVGKDTIKVAFSPDDLNHYKPVSANVNVCVYDNDSSVCGSGNNGGDSGNNGGDWSDNGSNPGTSSDNGSNPNGNISNNPQTGNIMLFVVWIIGFACIGYSFWYFKNVNKNGA